MNKIKASITVEASFIIPIMIWVGMAFLYLINIIGFNKELYDSMCDIAQTVSKYSYSYEKLKKYIHDNKKDEGINIAKICDDIDEYNLAAKSIKIKMIDKTDTRIVFGGVLGIFTNDSNIDSDNGDIMLVSDYYVRIPFVLFDKIIIPQRVKVHAREYIGTNYKEKDLQEDDEDIYVYLVDNSKVYHTYEDCTYIRIVVSQISINEVDIKRNKSGAKYYLCERCSKTSNINEVVFITDYGNRYHNSLNCTEIKRTIRKVKKSSVEGMRECAKCSKR